MTTARRVAPKDVESYLAAAQDKQRAMMEKLRTAIKSAAPGAEEIISYGIPGYRYHGMLAYFASAKRHVAVYPVSNDFLAAHKDEIQGYGTSGKGTLRFPLDRPVPVTLVRKWVKSRMKENEARAAAKAPRNAKRNEKRPTGKTQPKTR